MKNKKEVDKKVKYNNFEQRTYNNFDSLYANKQSQYRRLILSNSTLNALLKDYEKKKYYAELNFEREKAEFYASEPKLSEITAKLSRACTRYF